MAKSNNNKDQYEEFSKYYEAVGIKRGHFSKQLEFLKPYLEDRQCILDAACGTGYVANELVNIYQKKEFFYSDKSENLLKQVLEKENLNNNRLKRIEWIDLAKEYDIKFDLVYILGNSIGHVHSKEELTEVFYSIYSILKDEGVFLFDIRNWSKNISERAFNLPLHLDEFEIYVNREKIVYSTDYDFKGDRHWLFHKVANNSKSEVFNLSFLDINDIDLIKIGDATEFEINPIVNDSYPFSSYIARKKNANTI